MIAEKKLLIVGFWWPGSDKDGLEYPPVEHFIIPGWYNHHKQELDELVRFLAAGKVANAYKGSSSCRLCGKSNGSTELTDGTWLWPSGLSHYLTAHDVRLPPRFVEYVHGKFMDKLKEPGPLTIQDAGSFLRNILAAKKAE